MDQRGFFMRTFCRDEFNSNGLFSDFVQSNASHSNVQYTLRGMHYQVNGTEETKLVRCSRGKIQDVIIDLRPESDTFCHYISVELSEDNYTMLYVPIGFAHGFLTLEPVCDVLYMVSNFYSPENERGVRWNDSAFNIKWMAEPKFISEKDAHHKDFIKQQ